jgi:hypothetical protein
MMRSNPSKELTMIQELRHAHRINDRPAKSRDSIFFPKGYPIQARKHIANTSAQTGYAAQQFASNQ